MFIQFLILFFIVLISYQVFLAYSKRSLIEGMESTTEFAPYDINNPANALILAQQNAGNINYLKGRLDEMETMKTTVDSLSQQVDQLNQQMAGLVQQQSDLGQQLAGTTPPTITGTT